MMIMMMMVRPTYVYNNLTHLLYSLNVVAVVSIGQPPHLVKESVGSLVINVSLSTKISEDITILATITSVTASGNTFFTPCYLSQSFGSKFNVSTLPYMLHNYNRSRTFITF